MADIKNRLEKLQADNNYPGVARLVKLASNEGIERRDVLKFLAKDILTQQTKETKKKPTGHVVAMVPNELWNIDIFDMSKYAEVNKGYKYILACVDVFTRMAYAEPMKKKRRIAWRPERRSSLSLVRLRHSPGAY